MLNDIYACGLHVFYVVEQDDDELVVEPWVPRSMSSIDKHADEGIRLAQYFILLDVEANKLKRGLDPVFPSPIETVKINGRKVTRAFSPQPKGWLCAACRPHIGNLRAPARKQKDGDWYSIPIEDPPDAPDHTQLTLL